MLETLTQMAVGALLFGGGATWGAWFAMRVKNNDSIIPFAPVEQGGVAYEDDSESDDAEEGNYSGRRL